MPHLDATPKLVFYRLASVRKTKKIILLENRNRGDEAPRSLIVTALCQMDHMKVALPKPHLKPIKPIVFGKIALSLVNCPIILRVPSNNLHPTKPSGVVEELVAIHPLPSICIPTKDGHFTISCLSLPLVVWMISTTRKKLIMSCIVFSPSLRHLEYVPNLIEFIMNSQGGMALMYGRGSNFG